MATPATMTPMLRATLDDEVRDQLAGRIMKRDGVSDTVARKLVTTLSIPELTRLELEARDHAAPSFTSDYDPYARN